MMPEPSPAALVLQQAEATYVVTQFHDARLKQVQATYDIPQVSIVATS